MSTKYTYSISTNTLNGKVDINKLQNEIKTSNIPNAVDFISTDGDNVEIWFIVELGVDSQTILTGIINNHDGEVVVELSTQSVAIENVDITSTEKAIKIAITKLEGSSSLLVSHNFCDKTTWWGESVRVTQETLSADGYFTTYSSAHTHWIDLVNGKVPYEDKFSTSYKVKVYVNEVEVTSDFIVDYDNGKITFNSSQENKVIKASYSYSNGSGWTIAPTSGKVLKLLGTEVKFSDDVYMNTSLAFTIYAGPYPISKTSYKSMTDFLVCSKGEVSRLAKFGDMEYDFIVLNFDYVTSKELRSSQSVSIKISTENNIEMTGSLGVMTAYIMSIDE